MVQSDGVNCYSALSRRLIFSHNLTSIQDSTLNQSIQSKFFCFIIKHHQICIWFFRVMSAHYLEMAWNLPFSGRTKVFPAILILQMLSLFMNSNFFQKIFGARRARAKLRALKNEHIFRVLQKVAATKKLFCRNVRNGKKKYLDWQKFL